MRADLDRAVRHATEHRHSAAAGAADALASVAGQLTALAEAPATLAALGPLLPLMRFLSSGPPARRIAQLAALSRAGVVRFLGAGLQLDADGDAFVAASHTLGPAVVRTRYVVEARLPEGDVLSGDPLLGSLVRRGAGVPLGPAGGVRLQVDPDTYQICTPDGVHPARIALGTFASGGALGSLSRPGTDAPFFRQNHRTARWILTKLGALSHRDQRGS
jgi:hypothetical protein